ncbi:maleylpyruvate isomerase family mycothiol-dependent enzyme [Litorihabitans aurantiacus]|nr:maleylpyruvate isomerase family mycothiol-dependent enzyme [Litorihabitans aurantiacus]
MPQPPDPRGAATDLDVLAALQAAFATTVDTVDPDVPVPSCGRWRVRHLVVHLARVHHWAAGQASRTRETPLGRGPFDLPVLYRTCAEELLTTLRRLDPAAHAWTLSDDGVPREQQTGTVAFWHRRQKLETLVHLWDLRAAAGLATDVGPLGDATQWWDAVREVAEVMHPRQVRLGRVAAPPVALVLRRGDGGPEPVDVVLDGGSAVAPAPASPRVVVTGRAQDLGLMVWGRVPTASSALAVAGEGMADDDAHAALAGLVAAGLTP